MRPLPQQTSRPTGHDAGWLIKLADGRRYRADVMTLDQGVLRFTGRRDDPATGPRGPLHEHILPGKALCFARRRVTS